MTKAFARFRLGTEEDIADLQRIDLAASRLFEPTGLIDEGPDGPTPIPEAALRNGIAKKLLIVSLSDDTGFPNGFALMSRHSPDLYLDQISVDPAHGRRGIGANLLGLVIARADALKLRGVVLSTFRDLAWNGPFYARHGFVELAREDMKKWMLELETIQSETMDVSLRCFMRRPGALDKHWFRLPDLPVGRYPETDTSTDKPMSSDT